ncbi:MAG: GHMP kinase [Anaerolineae bacterium]|nr:GHMP kinase [Anaerolineae bacterium]
MFQTIPKTKPSVRIARSEMERTGVLVAQLKHHYQVDPAAIRVVKAPLRICPLGAHIDHQLGLVTGMTIDQSLLLAFAPTPDGAVRIESEDFEPPVSFGLSQVPPYTPRDWGNYVRGAVLALQQTYQLQNGLVGVIGGEMPIGGLSSSAAVTIAYLLALEAVNGLEVPAKENVELVRFTENKYIGLNNGILDQSVILFSQDNHLTFIDCRTVEVKQIPTPLRPGDFEILVVYSGVTRGLVGTDYNNRVAECQEAAQMLLPFSGNGANPASRLRHVDPAIFAAEGHCLPPTLKKRAMHYFGEMQRVVDGVAAWQQGDLKRLGTLISESGESSIKYYECGSPQLITLYEILRDTPGVYGTRFSGAGFRGCCIALIDPAARETIAEAVHRRYPVDHPDEAGLYSIHFCRPDGRAGLCRVR